MDIQGDLEYCITYFKNIFEPESLLVTPLRKFQLGGNEYGSNMLIRKKEGIGPPIEIRVAVVGNVDSGKSTLVGVLTRSVLDDGRGFARMKVFK